MSKRLRVLSGAVNDSPLRRGVYVLPNLITTGGLFSGFYSVICTLGGRYEIAAIMILVAHFFDGLDGRVARMTRTTSRFGVEYDSLADLVSFGVAPGILLYTWALQPWGTWGWLAASIYVTCGALRLARFNVQAESVEKNSFLGLPIPAAADMVSVTVLLYFFLGGEWVPQKPVPILLLTYVLAGLMVSSVPYFSFKEIRWRWRQPFSRLLGLIVAINLLVVYPQVVAFVVLSIYLVSGPIWWVIERNRERTQAEAVDEQGEQKLDRAGTRQ